MTKQNNSDNKFNIIMIALFIVLYILLTNKIADILSNSISDDNERLERYTMYIYFISIMGIIIAYFWIEDIKDIKDKDKDNKDNDNKDNDNKGNHIINKGLTYGGILLLLYTIFFYWDYLGDYSKLSLLIVSIISIAYYAYQ